MSYFTTGQVASICRVCSATVNKWFDCGDLEGFRLPTKGRPRRISRESLVAFLERNDLPVEWLTVEEERGVIV